MLKLGLTKKVTGWNLLSSVLLALALAGSSNPVDAQLTGTGDISDIRSTRHNLSKTGTGNVKADTETQVCVFCHTPHNATVTSIAPLWNRSVNTQTYTRYTSASLDANNIANGFNDQPAGSSVLCLSCHDGMVALGNVNVLPKNTGTPKGATGIAMSGQAGFDGKIPANYGVNTGFTRIGTDLTNDHPISITYNSSLVTADGELAAMNPSQGDTGTNGALIGIRRSGYKPLLPLEPTGPGGLGQVQCATCHDPHLNKSKFLRLNRLQANAGPSRSTNSSFTFNQANDIICLACHTKLGAAWANSAHANETVADETYTAAAAALRAFPDGSNTKVWQASCLNCHDTHTVQGSRRLLREGVTGTDATAITVPSGPAAGAVYQPGFNPQPVNGTDGNNTTSAIENTCFQCHRDPGGVNALTAQAGSTVPKIKTLFDLQYGMPARSDDQADPANLERHNVRDADLTELPENLGRGDKTARHAECPDCHNPHRLRRNSKFYGTPGDSNSTKRTHDAGSGAEGNVASGVLRGGWGVQPVFSSNQMRVWPQNPTSFNIKKGDPGANTSTLITSSYLTREYQLCFKCHSDFANGPLKTDFADIGYAGAIRGTSRRGTPILYSNGMQRYTNVAAEFGSVNAGVDVNGLAISNTDQGESGSNVGTACGGGDCASVGSTTNGTTTESVNHRSWHPVMFPTGRDRAERKMSSTGNTNIRPPFDVNMGKQTMQCNDCHGQGSSWTPGVGPVTTQPQGPHGSSYPFLLRGDWSLSTTKIGSLTNQVCGYCHQPGSGNSSGFGSSHNGGGQGAMNNAPCMFCHIAVPHGWKNKAFLVNLNCVGKEGGRAGDCENVSGGATSAKYLPPYYNGAKIGISTWARSGSWGQSSCGNNMQSCSSSY